MRIFRLALSALLVTAALSASPALAKKQQSVENIEFSNITCGEFVQDLGTADEEAAGLVFMWLDGYLSGVTGDTLLNWEGLSKFGEDLVNACGSSPNMKVLDVAKKVGIR